MVWTATIPFQLLQLLFTLIHHVLEMAVLVQKVWRHKTPSHDRHKMANRREEAGAPYLNGVDRHHPISPSAAAFHADTPCFGDGCPGLEGMGAQNTST